MIIGCLAKLFHGISHRANLQVGLKAYALRWEYLYEDVTVPGVVAGCFQLPA